VIFPTARVFRHARIGEQNIEPARLRVGFAPKRRSRSGKVDTSPGMPVTFFPMSFTAEGQFRLASPRFCKPTPFVHELFGRRQANPLGYRR